MSWLLITATPTLLMLAASGLARIETGLDGTRAAEPNATRSDSAVNPQFRRTPDDNRV